MVKIIIDIVIVCLLSPVVTSLADTQHLIWETEEKTKKVKIQYHKNTWKVPSPFPINRAAGDIKTDYIFEMTEPTGLKEKFDKNKGSITIWFRPTILLYPSGNISVYNLVRLQEMELYLPRQRYTGIELYVQSPWYWGHLTLPWLNKKWYRFLNLG